MLRMSSILDLKRPTAPKILEKHNDAKDRKGHGNDCQIEYSLMACAIYLSKKMFRLHFHFAGNQTGRKLSV